MKKRVLLLLPLFLGACSDGGESPIIKIEKLSVKVDSDNNSVEGEDYANKMDNLPTLKVGARKLYILSNWKELSSII